MTKDYGPLRLAWPDAYPLRFGALVTCNARLA